MEARSLPVEQPFAASRTMLDGLIAHLETPSAQRMTEADLERWMFAQGMPLLRQLTQDHLDLRSHREVRVRGGVKCADGTVRNHARVQDRPVESIFGEVRVYRLGYGDDGLASVFPADAELNLPAERYSLELRRRVVLEAVGHSYQASCVSVARTTAAHVPHRQAEQLVVRSGVDVEEFYELRRAQAASQPASPHDLLVISTDATGVPTRRNDLREATRKEAEAKPRAHKLAGVERSANDKRSKRHRMATVTAVYDVGPHERDAEQVIAELSREGEKDRSRPRPRASNKVVHATVRKEPETAIHEAFEEARRRDPAGVRCWVGLVDGSESQLALMRRKAAEFGVQLVLVLDLMHVLGYLWRAANCFTSGETERKAWVVERLRSLLTGKASDVAAGIRRSATLRGLRAKQRKAADVCANYLIKYRDCLRYADYLQWGLPIGSGVIEGCCRQVKDRMSITGAHWSIEGAEALLQMRAVCANDDFDEYWALHEQREFERNHLVHYAHQRIPATRAGERDWGHLRAVR